MTQKRKILKGWVYLSLALVFLASCTTTKHLREDETLLKRNTIELQEAEEIESANELRKELKRTVYQQPNRKFFVVFPREWFELKSRTRQDTSWLGRFALRNIAEKPVFVDSNLVDRSSQNMELYLKRKGLFNAQVATDLRTWSNDKKAEVTYNVDPGKPFILDSLTLICPDPVVYKLLMTKLAHKWPVGKPFSAETYSQFKTDVTNILRNNGYYQFFPNFISRFQAYDTTDFKVDAAVRIKPPSGDSTFRVFTIRNIYVYPEYNPIAGSRNWVEHEVDGIIFRDTSLNHIVKPKVITDRISTMPGDVYKQSAYSQTIGTLGRLSVYKFPNISIIEVDSNQLDYHIYLRRYKFFTTKGNIALVYSTFSSNNRSFGGSLSASTTYNNAFGGSEQINAGFDAQYEKVNNGGQGSDGTEIVDISPYFNISIPRSIDLFGSVRAMNRISIADKRIMSDELYDVMQNNAITTFNINFGHYANQDIYRINSFEINYNLRWQWTNNREYEMTLLGLNYWSPKEKERFDEVAGDNVLYRRSFEKQFLTGFVFQSFRYNQQTNQDALGRTNGWSVFFETSGLEIAAMNRIAKWASKDNKPLINQVELGSDTVQFSQFARLELERRWSKQFLNKTSMHYRVRTGAALSLDRDLTVPFLKRFHVGGPNSIRAWQVRELGPGSNRDEVANEKNVPYFQVGDVKLEMSAEYRFDLFWYLKGAFFVDAGNIWNVDSDAPSNTLLTSDFWKQIAIGGGFGLRFDVEYFLFRLDVGLPVKNNFRDTDPEDPTYVGSYFRNPKYYKFGDLNFNLGVGYPF